MSRDLEYEKNSIGYDGQYPDGGIKCKNYELCKAVLPDWWYDCKGCYLCINCILFKWNELEFKYEEQECVVCNENVNVILKFPTNCGHYYCCNCSRAILFWDETRLHLDPTKYGCPPCPNGCKNPEKGRQCYCEEYDEVQEKWQEDNPEEFELWNEDEHYSIHNTKDDFYGNKKCPLCRAVYKK